VLNITHSRCVQETELPNYFSFFTICRLFFLSVGALNAQFLYNSITCWRHLNIILELYSASPNCTLKILCSALFEGVSAPPNGWQTFSSNLAAAKEGELHSTPKSILSRKDNVASIAVLSIRLRLQLCRHLFKVMLRFRLRHFCLIFRKMCFACFFFFQKDTKCSEELEENLPVLHC
jgi:hypothetical protein